MKNFLCQIRILKLLSLLTFFKIKECYVNGDKLNESVPAVFEQIRRKEYQLTWAPKKTSDRQFAKELKRRSKIEQQAKQEAQEIVEETKMIDNQEEQHINKDEVMDMLGVKAKTYHKTPIQYSITPTSDHLVS